MNLVCAKRGSQDGCLVEKHCKDYKIYLYNYQEYINIILILIKART